MAFWHSGNCSFTVQLWHPSINLSEMKLVHAPVWVLFKKVPLELWSLLGFSTMASAVGFPVHSEHSELKPYTNGVVKLRVVIELDKPHPSSVRVTDKLGNSVHLPVEFLKIPPKCGGCGEFGHLRLRCPQPLCKQTSPSTDFPAYMGVMASPPSAAKESSSQSSPSTSHSPSSVVRSPMSVASVRSARSITQVDLGRPIVMADSSKSVPLNASSDRILRKVERSNSLPLTFASTSADTSGWTYVAKKSNTNTKKDSSSPPLLPPVASVPVPGAQFSEEEEFISVAQSILRNRLAAVDANAPRNSTARSRKHERKKIRQKMLMLSSGSGQDHGSTSFASVSN